MYKEIWGLFLLGACSAVLLMAAIGLPAVHKDLARVECKTRAEYATTLADSVAFASKIKGCPALLFTEKSR